MLKFTIENRPPCLAYRKKTPVWLYFVQEPFIVQTQEGSFDISPETVEGWEDGYFVAYPDDGSKPYAIAPSYVRANYELAPAQGE